MNPDYFTYLVETDGNFAKRFTLLSTHFKRMGNYNPEWTLIDVMVFEASLFLSRSYGNGEFYYQKHRWESLLRTTWYLIRENSMVKFIDMGILSIERREPKKMNYYQVHYDAIIDNLELIYDFSNLSEDDKSGYKGRMKIFFEWWRDHDFNDGTKLTLEEGSPEIKREELRAADEVETAEKAVLSVDD
ncbi:hypothetical protein ACG2F4_05180 [Halalkalibaculum sp. DA3122]|uniref:hypothetical protein n=1 Tax=Halalkalibaculum sp. DA3122 TaxID=3373607 RepID=UPI003753ED74